MFSEERVTFEAEGDTCEGVLARPQDRKPVSAAVLLAPHALMGGNMDNNVVHHLARRGAEEGVLTLRFNYRGVDGSTLRLPGGLSARRYFAEMEERRDYARLLPEVFAAIRFVQAAAPDLTDTSLLGYSLGAVLAGWMTPEAGLARVICVSLPNARFSVEAFATLDLPKVFIAGDQDPFFDAKAFQRDFAQWPEPKRLIPFINGDHFFRGEEERLFQTVRQHLIPG